MKLVPIESRANPLLKKVASLHQRPKREKLGLFLLEGPKLISEAFKKGVTLEAIIAQKSFLAEGKINLVKADIDSLFVVEDKLFSLLYTTETSCGILAVGKIKVHTIEEVFDGDRTLVVIGDAIQDPGNAGTMIRTALAFGATGIIFTKGSADPYSPKVVRSSMGALFSLPVVFDIEPGKLIKQLRERQIVLVALQPSALQPLDQFLDQLNCKTPIAYAFGNEGQGLEQLLIDNADSLIQIPIASQIESLNVAISLGIVLYAHTQKARIASDDCNKIKM